MTGTDKIRTSLVAHASAVCIVVAAICPNSSAEIARIVAFGDSMTDTGNLFEASGGHVNAPPYWEGRATNGPVWIEYLADLLDVPRPVASRLGGTNWAVGGAPTGQGSFIETRAPPTGGLPPDIEIEIPRLGMQIDEMLATHTLSASDLVVVWAGFNDLQPALPGGPFSPEQIVSNLNDHIANLQEAGATNFLLANLHSGDSRSTFNGLWKTRVDEMRQTLPGDFYFLDFASLVAQVSRQQADFGFNNDTSPIIHRTVANPDEYTNWDGFHVTTAYHRVIAEGALEALRHVEGDFNDNGLVEQGDLDMVLLNWGQRASGDLLTTSGWTNDPPTRRLIDQDELDRVLMNWGKQPLIRATPYIQAGIPEPASVTLLLVAVFAVLSTKRFQCILFMVIRIIRQADLQMVSLMIFLLAPRSASAQADSIINVPPDPAPTSIGANAQLNLVAGGVLPSGFDANSGSEVNISGGVISSSFNANSGSVVNISGGLVGTEFDANSGSEVNITGGAIGFGFSAHEGSQVNIWGGEFLLNGIRPSGPTVTLTPSDVLTGTLEDGSPFIFTDLTVDEDDELTYRINGVILTDTPLPAIDTTPINVSDESTIHGLRAGQTLTLEVGGDLGDNFTAVNATLNVIEGEIGHFFQVAGTEVNISGGHVGLAATALDGSVVNISDGSIGPAFWALAGSEVNISGGDIGLDFWALDGSEVNISGGSIVGFRAFEGSQVKISGGAVDELLPDGGQVAISGGSINGIVEAEAGSQVVVTGGNPRSGIHVHNGSRVAISGGTTRDFDAYDDSEVHLYGTQFTLDGTELPDLAMGEPFAILDRDLHLSGIFTDGSPFSYYLSSHFGAGLDNSDSFVSSDATLTVTLVSLLDGDYNSNGTVDQGDLDLILLNWGEELFNPFSAGWVNDLPEGRVDQNELDAVLLNWGNSVTGLGVSGVPEPGSLLVLGIALALLGVRRCMKQKPADHVP